MPDTEMRGLALAVGSVWLLIRDDGAEPLESGLAIEKRAFELRRLGGVEDGLEGWSGFLAEVDQIPPGDEWWGDQGFVGKVFAAGDEESVIVEQSVAGGAVDSVELEFLVEGVAGQEAFEFGHAHLLNVLEGHVVFDEGDDVVADAVGKPKTLEDGGRHVGTDVLVGVEADAAGLVGEGGRGFADVVEEDSEDEGGGGIGWEESQHDAGVDKYVAFGMKLRRLLTAGEVGDFGEEEAEETAGVEEVEAANAGGGGENFHQFVADSFRADGVDPGSRGANGLPGRRVDLEVQGGGEPDGAKHAKFVFAESVGGIADGAEGAGFQVGEAVDVIENAVFDGVVEETVDGEIAALGVGAGIREFDGFRAATVEVLAIAAERRDFVFGAALEDDDHAKLRADRNGSREESRDLPRVRAGGNVNVVRGHSTNSVADASAGKVGDVPGLAEAADDGGGGGDGHETSGRIARFYRGCP